MTWWQKFALGFGAAFAITLVVALAVGHSYAFEAAVMVGLLCGVAVLAAR